MLAETLILLLVVLPFLGAIAATTMPVSARNGEVVLGGGVMLAGLVALAAGRRLAGIRLHSDTSGLTVSAGRPRPCSFRRTPTTWPGSSRRSTPPFR